MFAKKVLDDIRPTESGCGDHTLATGSGPIQLSAAPEHPARHGYMLGTNIAELFRFLD